MKRHTIMLVLIAAAGLPLAGARAAESMPTLDDLLNLTGPTAPDTTGGAQPDTPADAEPPALDPDMLEGIAQPGADQFKQALELMQQAASRIGSDMDPGVETQRMQEEILKKLDQMIAEQSKKRPNSKPSSSSGGSQNQQQQQDQGSQQNASKQQQQQQKQGAQQGGEGDPQRTATGENQGDFSPGQQRQAQPDTSQFLENRSQWGNLPPRVRDELMQGMSETLSSVYRKDTQDYYERLAKEQQE